MSRKSQLHRFSLLVYDYLSIWFFLRKRGSSVSPASAPWCLQTLFSTTWLAHSEWLQRFTFIWLVHPMWVSPALHDRCRLNCFWLARYTQLGCSVSPVPLPFSVVNPPYCHPLSYHIQSTSYHRNHHDSAVHLERSGLVLPNISWAFFVQKNKPVVAVCFAVVSSTNNHR